MRGIAAQAGILAASFAEQGLTAAPEIFEGTWSFETLFGAEGMPGFRVAEERLKGPPALAEPGAWIKAYPCCASAHRPIDAMLHLQRTAGFAAEDIERVDAFVSTIVQKNLMYERPRDEMEGRFSLNHCLAVAACRGSADLAGFTLAALADPELVAFWPKVFMQLDPEIPANLAPASGEERCRLVVTLAGGKQARTYGRLSERASAGADDGRGPVAQVQGLHQGCAVSGRGRCGARRVARRWSARPISTRS